MTRLPLRIQVAVAFTATTAVLLAILGFAVYQVLEGALEDAARTRLESQLTALSAVPSADREAAVRALGPPVFAQLLTLRSGVVAGSPQVPEALVSAADLPGAGSVREEERGVQLAGQREPEQAMLMVRVDDGRVLVVGTSREDLLDTLQTALTTMLVGCLAALAVAAALGYAVAGAALRPVERMREQASRISSDPTGERLPVPPSHDEVQRLGATLNAMLDRLEEGLVRERRFVAEAGHELRTPLAMLRMEIDLALAGHRSEGELVEALRSAGEEVDRLTRLSADLLTLSSSSEPPSVPDRVDVSELLDAVASRARPAFAGTGRNLSVDTEGCLIVRGDRDRLERALTNLVDNALGHGAGDVTLSAHAAVSRAGDATVRIRVRDAGNGTPGSFPEHPLDPFTRGPVARPGRGNGLGLPIVRAIVGAHGGALDVESDAAEGTVVTLDLPQVSQLT